MHALTMGLLAALVAATSAAGQASYDVRELAGYRLTPPVFAQFDAASQQIAEAMRGDARFAGAPLFTREVALSDDVSAAATALDARLTADVVLATALAGAHISPREYTKFAIALIAAHLAHEFLNSGALRAVPPGVASDNVAFVRANGPRVGVVLRDLGVAD